MSCDEKRPITCFHEGLDGSNMSEPPGPSPSKNKTNRGTSQSTSETREIWMSEETKKREKRGEKENGTADDVHLCCSYLSGGWEGILSSYTACMCVFVRYRVCVLCVCVCMYHDSDAQCSIWLTGLGAGELKKVSGHLTYGRGREAMISGGAIVVYM